MKLSIITVTLNSMNLLRKTILSLISQTFSDFEYIVIDGKSTDNTLKMVEYYSSHFKKLLILSEKDFGIYDAMNKGVSYASGEYIWFLNSGDTLYCSDTIEQIMDELCNSSIDIFYGNLWKKNKGIINQASKINSLFFFREKMLCHQTIIAKKECLIKYPFDTSWLYGADRNWLINAYNNRCEFLHISLPLVRYDIFGITSLPENEKKVWMESIKILKKYYGFPIIPIAHTKRVVFKTIPAFIKKKFTTIKWLIRFILRNITRKLYYPGSTYYCPCCNKHLRSFANYNYKEVTIANSSLFTKTYKHIQCPYCNSLPRHRIMAYYLKKNLDSLLNKKILIFGMLEAEKTFLTQNNFTYIYADLFDKQAEYQEDIQNLTFQDCSIDIIICNHVLEHVDSVSMALNELHRILTPTGYILLSVPINCSLNATYESNQELTEKECKILYGQTDHRRLFGKNFSSIITQAGFIVEELDGSSFPPNILPIIGPANTDINIIYKCSKSIN